MTRSSRHWVLRGFYGALGSGSTIERAVAAGRAKQIFSHSFGEEWARPVLFQTDDAPVVRRRDVPISPPEVQLATPAGTPEEKTAQILLDMKVSNLKMLQDQWSRVDEARPSTGY